MGTHPLSNLPKRTPDAMTTPNSAPKPPLTGVGGWLAFLCIALTLLSPLVSVGQTIKVYEELAPRFAAFPPLRIGWMIEVILFGAMVLYGVYTGLQLWSKNTGAVVHAKRLFVLMPIATAVGCVPYFLIGLPTDAVAGIATESGKDIVKTVIACALWYAYLNRSRRARNTFPQDFPAALPPSVSKGPTA
jgi:hypothetical protein